MLWHCSHMLFPFGCMNLWLPIQIYYRAVMSIRSLLTNHARQALRAIAGNGEIYGMRSKLRWIWLSRSAEHSHKWIYTMKINHIVKYFLHLLKTFVVLYSALLLLVTRQASKLLWPQAGWGFGILRWGLSRILLATKGDNFPFGRFGTVFAFFFSLGGDSLGHSAPNRWFQFLGRSLS